MPTATYIPLATVTVAIAATSVTFSSIPSSFRDVRLVMVGTSTPTGTDVSVLVNGDTSNIYTSVRMLGDGNNTVSSTTSGSIGTWLRFSGGTATGNNILDFMDYSATDKHKTILMRTNQADSLSAARAGRYGSTSAITTIRVSADSGMFAAGCVFSLYGIGA